MDQFNGIEERRDSQPALGKGLVCSGVNGESSTLFDDLRPDCGWNPDFAEEFREQFKIGKRRKIDQWTAVGDNDHSSPREIGLRQVALDPLQIGEVIGQILGSVIVLGNIPHPGQFHELNPRETEILRGLGRRNTTFIEEPKDGGLQGIVAKALLGAFVQSLLRDRDLNFNLHDNSIVRRDREPLPNLLWFTLEDGRLCVRLSDQNDENAPVGRRQPGEAVTGNGWFGFPALTGRIHHMSRFTTLSVRVGKWPDSSSA
jgi:hypothetical protein